MNIGTFAPNYNRIVDKTQIPTCNIMGVNIAAINMEWLYVCFKRTYHCYSFW